MPDIFVDPGKPQEEKPNTPEKIEALGDTQEVIAPTPEVKPEIKEEIKPQTKEKSKHRPHLFTSFAPNPPSVVSFNDKNEDEVLLLFLRKHLITNLPWILKALLMAAVPIIFEVLNSFGYFTVTLLTPEVKTLIYAFYYFFIFAGYVFVNYMTWFYNISLVTNERIVDIDFSDLVFENVSATKLSQVEDVNYKQIGLARSIFDYGDILVQTAASTDEFQFASVPHPEKVIRIINNLIGKESNA